jgi:hypothetical protein
MSKVEPEFPLPIRIRGRLFWRRTQLESYKRELLAFATGVPLKPNASPDDQIEVFVNSDQVAKEFGFNRRTLGRRIAKRDIPSVQGTA